MYFPYIFLNVRTHYFLQVGFSFITQTEMSRYFSGHARTPYDTLYKTNFTIQKRAPGSSQRVK